MNNETKTLNSKINYSNLTHYFKTKSNLISFSTFSRPLGLNRKIRNDSKDLQKAKEKQRKVRRNVRETRSWKREHKSKEKKSTIENLEMIYEAGEKLSNCLIIKPQLFLKLNMKQNVEKESKY